MVLEGEAEEKSCPPKPKTKRFTGGFPMLGLPDYKRAENYPQVAPNLPGEPVVQSYKHYKSLCKKHGLVETGVSNEAKKRAKFYKRKPADMQAEVKTKATQKRKKAG